MKYQKSEVGKAKAHDRTLGLSAVERALFVLVDGKRSNRELLNLTAGMQSSPHNLLRLYELNLIEEVEEVFAPTQNETRLSDETRMMLGQISEFPSSGLKPGAAKTPTLASAADGELFARALPVAHELAKLLGITRMALKFEILSAGNLSDLRRLLPSMQTEMGKSACAELAAILAGNS